MDFGCGSGRDTKYFLGNGYQVDATDGSEELCKIASNYTGISVKRMLFEAFEKYMQDIPELQIEEYWLISDVRPGRGEEKWLNLILRKLDIH